MPTKSRLDQILVERGLAPSREKAKALIMSGAVFVRGHRCDKAGHAVDCAAEIEVRGAACPYVSRGGVKLEGALEAFGIDPKAMRCLDVGVSTGGFTDCLLGRGAAQVIGVDVGYGQLDWKLRTDERVILHERTNARRMTPKLVGDPVDLAVIDVSFISLKLILPAVVACVHEGGIILPMVKPQFEVGKGNVGAGGVVRDENLRLEAVESVRQFGREELGFSDHGFAESPLKGPKGNVEYFIHFTRG
jgi:23S rRNA (cytidine1920-2'-O)/16S rRNA (cytidine1409-2'-O)-methyltransferase